MSVATKYQGGMVNEVTYGTPVTVTRFFEVVSDSLKPDYGRIESKGIRAGTGVQRSGTWQPYVLGGGGDITIEVPTKGWGYWLQHILGGVATTGPVTSRYTHTGTLGTPGKFTWQRDAPFFASDTDQPMTFQGCKITSWELSNSVGGFLLVKLSVDCEDMDTSTSLATASYPSGIELMSFVGGTVTVAGTAFNVTDIKLGVDLGLKTDRRYIRGAAQKLEPLRVGMPQLTWSMTADFDSLTQVNRVASATAAGAMATIVAAWQGPTVIPATAVFPDLTATIQNARFDQGFPDVSGPIALQQQLKGVGLDDTSVAPISVVYRSADSTP